jgi:hypothetical protein
MPAVVPPSIRFKRGTRAQIDAAAVAGQLHVAEPYVVTDELPMRLVFGTAINAYAQVAGGSASASSHHHVQGTPQADWDIVHNLGYMPGGILVHDSAGTVVVGEPEHVSVNHLIIHFTAGFSGVADLS